MAAGDPVQLDDAGRSRIGAAVRKAEKRTGLQFCVALGPTPGDAHATAEHLFTDAHLGERPAVLILVAPQERQVEVITSELVRSRVPDAACEDAIDVMIQRFRHGDLVGGVVAGVDHLARTAGARRRGRRGRDLPDLVE